MMNPLSADLHSPYINGGNNPKKKRHEKLLPIDLEYETWRLDMLHAIWGPQEKLPRPRRGRV